jgi:hypothetical protein
MPNLDYMMGVVGQSSRSWQTCVRLSLCSCVSIHGSHLHRLCNVSTLPMSFPSCWIWHSAPYKFLACNLLICADELFEALFKSWQLCRVTRNVARLWHHCCRCWNAPPTATLCSHPLFGFRKRPASVECQWVQFFHMEEFLDTPC